MRFGEHIVVSGITGSGKTTFVKKIIPKRNVIVFDLKGMGEWDNFFEHSTILYSKDFLFGRKINGNKDNVYIIKFYALCEDIIKDFEAIITFLYENIRSRYVIVIDDAFPVATSKILEKMFSISRSKFTLIIVSQYLKSFATMIKANACHLYFFTQNVWATEKLDFLTKRDRNIISGLRQYSFYCVNGYTGERKIYIV